MLDLYSNYFLLRLVSNELGLIKRPHSGSFLTSLDWLSVCNASLVISNVRNAGQKRTHFKQVRVLKSFLLICRFYLLKSNKVVTFVLVMTGEELKKLRKKAGWTQQELAEKLGTYKQSISDWEHNKRKISRLYVNEIKRIFAEYL